jgi:hypothetical protein
MGYIWAAWFLVWLFEPAILRWVCAADQDPALGETSRGAALRVSSERE